tara:strand:- start:113 stop:448 length:336 start_codon:yes stop_codon:yes gene_type:complete
VVGRHVESTSEIERFQRWLQSEMAEASSIQDRGEREKRLLQIDIAISETIRYRGILENLEKPPSSPFVHRENPVRAKSNSEVKPVTKSGECHICGAIKSNDLEFCPVCGEF